MSEVRIGVDIGGTFTDVALSHAGSVSTCKVLTDADRPEMGILKGIRLAVARNEIEPSDIVQIIHGTTLIANALIERRGARTAFITTDGFRDVIEMRSENRFEQYDLDIQLPRPLIPRENRFTVSERIGPGGEVLLDLDRTEINRLVGRVVEGGFDSVAVGFMHAYANDRHEVMMAEALNASASDLSISISSVVSPQMRELPRFNTVVANAYVRPIIADYLGRLIRRLREVGIKSPVFMFHSGGGLMSMEAAMEQPIRLLESGPAGGAIFAAGIAKSNAVDNALSLDMGGTTAKICLIENGLPKTTNSFEVARTYRFKRGSGMTVSTPVVEMVEIGAGGGSIATIDAMDRIQVGPRSAGSKPGPACYQRGGEEPTVTDANLLLGRLDPQEFAAGAIPLEPTLSANAINSNVSEPAGLSETDASFAVTEVVDENMANAARVHTIENGRDIEQFDMIAFGGGAPLHACRLCEKLGIDRLIIPPGAGVGSAIGFLRAPFSYEASRGMFQRIEAFDDDAVSATIESMQTEAGEFVAEGAGGAPTTTRLTVFMRYSGQGWEIPVSMEPHMLTRNNRAGILDAFESAYSTLFGRTIEGLPVEITNWSLEVSTEPPPVEIVETRSRGRTPATWRDRKIFDAALRRYVMAREVYRADLNPGDSIDGPATISEDETTTIVTSGFQASIESDGSILLERKKAKR